MVTRIYFGYRILIVFHMFLVKILGSLMPELFLEILNGQLLTVSKGLDRIALMLDFHIFLVNPDLFSLLYILIKLVKGFFRILSTMIVWHSRWALTRGRSFDEILLSKFFETFLVESIVSCDAPSLWHSLDNIVGQAVDDWSMLHLGLLFLNESMLMIDNLGVLFHHVELLMREEFVEISIGLILVQD